MRELKGSDWGLKVDKSRATVSHPLRGTCYPRESGLNHSNPSPSQNNNRDGKGLNSSSTKKL